MHALHPAWGGMLGSYNPLLNLLYINIYMYCECTPDQTNKQIEENYNEKH